MKLTSCGHGMNSGAQIGLIDACNRAASTHPETEYSTRASLKVRGGRRIEMKRNQKLSLAIATALSTMAPAAFGQVSLSNGVGGTYGQDFNALATGGLTNTWTDNTTIP